MQAKLKQIEKSARKANSYYDMVTCLFKLILFSEIFENSKTINTFDMLLDIEVINKLESFNNMRRVRYVIGYRRYNRFESFDSIRRKNK